MIEDRHGTYYARRVIPLALRPFMPEPWQGKAEWRRTLGTKDPKAAKRAHIAMLARMDADVSVAETRRNASDRDGPTDADMATLAEWFGPESPHRDDRFREVGRREDEEAFAEVRAQVAAAHSHRFDAPLRRSVVLPRGPGGVPDLSNASRSSMGGVRRRGCDADLRLPMPLLRPGVLDAGARRRDPDLPGLFRQ